MRLGSRVVIARGCNLGEVGTIMDYKDHGKSIVVGLDSGYSVDKGKSELIEVDDIIFTQYKEGLNIISVTNMLFGEIHEKVDTHSKAIYKIKWENGTSTDKELNNKEDYIVI